MDKKLFDFIKYRVQTFFFNTTSEMSEVRELANSILDDVIKDVEETASDKPNSSDVDIAITRVLKARLIGEEN